MSPTRILIAGIGNIFLGDDAFGVEVAQQLLRKTFPADVRVVDFGIRGLDLVYALQDGCEVAIFIDAVPRGDGPPGTLYLLEPQLDESEEAAPLIEAHAMDPMKVLKTAAAMGAMPKKVFIVGCEPMTAPDVADEGEMPLALSAPVAAAVGKAVAMVETLVEQICARVPSPATDAGCKEVPSWLI